MRPVVIGLAAVVCTIVVIGALEARRENEAALADLRARVLDAEEQVRRMQQQLYSDAGVPSDRRSLEAGRFGEGDSPPWYGGEPRRPWEKAGPENGSETKKPPHSAWPFP